MVGLANTQMPKDAMRKDLRFAPAGKRIAATLVDVVLLAVFTWVLIGVIGTQLMEIPKAPFHQSLMMVLCTYVLLCWIFYNHFILPASKRRASIGKQIMGLTIISADGRTMSSTQAVQRVFGQLMSMATGLIGYLLFLGDLEGKALHDNLAATRVIIKSSDAVSGGDDE